MKLIEIINSTTQAVVTNGKINLGNIDKSINQCAFSYNGTDTLTLKQNGYYLVMFKSDVTSTATDQVVSIGLEGNNATSPVAEATTTLVTTGTTQTLNFFKICKVCGSSLNISILNTGTATTGITNTILSVIKIG